ncbi:unnamed protein product [Thlaspi arvense]|uniref:Uncharacterized protein n=1 Tax=Thlaspi arvense TaxID=13288 RepID=A0AAU9S2W0_THLAR|nr:unnamed protein product [Thlaspi arvense]
MADPSSSSCPALGTYSRPSAKYGIYASGCHGRSIPICTKNAQEGGANSPHAIVEQDESSSGFQFVVDLHCQEIS